MNRLMNRRAAAPLLALCVVALVGGAAYAQRQLKAAAGRPEIKVEHVKPGEILDWQIVSANEGTGAEREYKAVGHIPAGTVLVAGSAAAESGSTVTYSVDGGKTFSTQPVVEERQPDGTVKTVPAPVSMYTEVRYEWSDALAPGGKLSASYKVRVR